MNETRPAVRWLYLAVGTVALLFAGIIYAWSILKAPLAAEFGWSASSLSLNFTLTMCFFCFGGMLGGFMLKKIGFFPALIVCAALSAVGFVLASMLSGSISMLYISYGVLAGLGIGAAYNVIISTVSAWFKDKKGLCSGVLMMGFGASALILGSAADSLINQPAIGWRGAFRILGIALGVVLIIAGLIIKRPKETSTQAAAGAAVSANDKTTAEMLRSVTFYKAFILIVFLAAVGNTVISMAKDLALSVGTAASTATALVGILSVCNGLGRVITGFIFDKLGRRKTMLIANCGAILAAGVLLSAVAASSVTLCIFGLCLTGLSYGTCPTVTSAFTSEVFGTKYFSNNFPVMNLNLLFASFIATGSSLIAGATGSYVASFVLLAVLCIIALGLNLSIKE